ncbi:MAG: sensor domain-containing diguanylate cyclase [Deltaproteobacteria bacterium]|nr:sensor domain-containing diguanylate cyclase [Deltaproteobacteria bacterium]
MNLESLIHRIEELENENRALKAEIEERTLIMETLYDSEQHLYAMISCVPGAVYRFDIDDMLYMNYVSDEIFNITGFSSSNFTFDKNRIYRDIIHEDDAERVNKTIDERINEKDTEPFLIEYRIIDANNDIRWCSEKGRVLFNSSGDPLFIDGTIFDITERKRTDEHLLSVNNDLKRLASIDPLTQLANRRHFMGSLDMEWKRMYREKKFISLIMCDIDYFKLFNDNYGHQEGDKCLYAVAQAINSALNRPADLASRFGGEEFIVLLPDTDIKGASKVAEFIRSKVFNLEIPHKYSLVDQYISLSLGPASIIPGSNNDPDLLIKEADNALYKAKKMGRNRVCSGN